MKSKVFRNYWLLSLAGVLAASFYPVYMGASVVSDMIRYGTVYAGNYPKYVIPYAPIALSLIVGVALIPVAIKYAKRFATLAGSAISAIVFFASEVLLENMVTVTRTETEVFSKLEDWQMFMCYIPPDAMYERTWTEVDVLLGEYSPAFKLHFYLISVVLIVSILNCFYGFAEMIQTKNKSRLKPLVIQSAASAAFLGMCIWACFTAFYRTGEIHVSLRSALLMSAFFILFGITAGIYLVSFTLNKRRLFSVALPAAVASAVTLVMYIGEMILLSGHLYRFGSGSFFDGLPGIVLAPVDIAVIILSGAITAVIANLLRADRKSAENAAA